MSFVLQFKPLEYRSINIVSSPSFPPNYPIIFIDLPLIYPYLRSHLFANSLNKILCPPSNLTLVFPLFQLAFPQLLPIFPLLSTSFANGSTSSISTFYSISPVRSAGFESRHYTVLPPPSSISSKFGKWG